MKNTKLLIIFSLLWLEAIPTTLDTTTMISQSLFLMKFTDEFHFVNVDPGEFELYKLNAAMDNISRVYLVALTDGTYIG